MMAKCFVVIGTVAALVGGCSAYSYEVHTHQNLTRHAYDQSVLADPVLSPLLAFGIADQGEARFVTRPLDDMYPFADLESIVATPRQVVALGAYQEDIPLLDSRFLNHFYDPQQGGIGFNMPVLGWGLPSPNWALEDQGQISSQQDSLRDALEFHRLALTLPEQSERDTSLARLLEILGRSVHHLQDMSQPAHVRNDGHAPWDFDIYEDFTNELFGAGRGDAIPRTSPYQSGTVDLDTFDTARKFWSNYGRGIAEFTSRNFVSKDTNFRGSPNAFLTDSNHPSPVVAGTTTVTLGELGINTQLPFWTPIIFLRTRVHDAYSNLSYENDRASTYSVFAPNLFDFGMRNVMTQNRFNFARNYEFLLPRAIAYSAGLINYYFRGRLQIENVSSDNSVITITIRNASAPDFALGSGLPGFRLYYDAVDGRRREIEVDELDDPGSELEFDATRRLSFTAPADVDLRRQSQYLLMFDGMIGTETGVAAVAFGIPGTGFRIVPNYVTADGVSGARNVSWSGSAWAVKQAAEYSAGEIDWKGHRPEDVLTWGTGRRYHAGSGGGPVYMSGRVLTFGPVSGYGIIGASIRYINGQRVLNLAAESGGVIRIYSRSFAEHYENEEMWSEANPLGWRLVYSGNHGYPYTGFFFNASGDEGQYIARHPDNGAPHRRVKVNLSGFTGTAVEFPAIATVTRTQRYTTSVENTLDIEHGVCVVRPAYPVGRIERADDDGCQREEYSGTKTRVDQYTATEQYADRTLFCVDYRGDQEVFCELLPPSSPIVESALTETLTEEQFRESNGLCGGTDRLDVQYSKTMTIENNPARIMKIGNLEIPWTAFNETKSSNRYWGGAFRSPENYAGDDTEYRAYTNRTTRLIHFDARHDFAVYEEHLLEAVSDSTSEYSSAGPGPSNISGSSVQSERVVMQLGGQRQMLFEETEPDEYQTPGTAYPPTLPYDSVGNCVPFPPSDQLILLCHTEF